MKVVAHLVCVYVFVCVCVCLCVCVCVCVYCEVAAVRWGSRGRQCGSVAVQVSSSDKYSHIRRTVAYLLVIFDQGNAV